MDINNYFKKVNEKIDAMSNEEFLDFLKEAGLEDCPLKSDLNLTYNFSDDTDYLSYYDNIMVGCYAFPIEQVDIKQDEHCVAYGDATKYPYNIEENKNFVLEVA